MPLKDFVVDIYGIFTASEALQQSTPPPHTHTSVPLDCDPNTKVCADL